MAFGLSDSALASINEVTVRRARLVLGWVTVSGGSTPGAGNLSQYITSHPGQLSLAGHPYVGMRNECQPFSQRAVMLWGQGVKAGIVGV